MPIFEYYCQECQSKFEEIVFGNELPSCPNCQAHSCQKLISRPCRQHNNAQGGNMESSPPSAGMSKCSGCSGGNCATC